MQRSIIWKQFFKRSLQPIHVFVDKGCESVVAEHLSFMANKNIVVVPELRSLPSFYWLPKLHKQPYGARFIAVSNKCTTKPLSKLLTSCLSTISCHLKQYCSGVLTVGVAQESSTHLSFVMELFKRQLLTNRQPILYVSQFTLHLYKQLLRASC